MCRYCTAPGGSNGKVGPFVGQVTQEFLNEVDFINAVELFGLVRIVRFIADICLKNARRSFDKVTSPQCF